MDQFFIRLDDASDYMDNSKWQKMEQLLDKYSVKPIFGVIPDNNDITLISKYEKNNDFWKLINKWTNKAWIPAMHGFNHSYITDCGGLNPVNRRSEFAGLSYEEQAEKIKMGYTILKDHGIEADIFFAPAHTFDENTLEAIKNETPIRVISDTIANDIYYKDGFFYIPQQSGRVRNLPFKTVTFCYHPNTMEEEDFRKLSAFLEKNGEKAGVLKKDLLVRRKLSLYDKFLKNIYFLRKK